MVCLLDLMNDIFFYYDCYVGMSRVIYADAQEKKLRKKSSSRRKKKKQTDYVARLSESRSRDVSLSQTKSVVGPLKVFDQFLFQLLQFSFLFLVFNSPGF